MNKTSIKISFIIPCLNEEEGLKIVIPEIISVANKNNIDYEIVLADNNSTDNSVFVAKEIMNKLDLDSKLIVIKEMVKGYGSAYQAGFNNASGDVFIMADADGTYDFNNINNFLNKINEGYDMVVGNRFSGKMEKQSMPFLNRYVGNPILSGLVRVLFNIKIKDIHSGMRCIKKDAYFKLGLYSKGMDYASEMIIQAKKKGLKIIEIPMNYRVRSGESKLNRIEDGWKHLKFILTHAPNHTLLIPGIILFISGFMIDKFSTVNLNSISIIFPIIGYQLIIFYILNKIYNFYHLGYKDYLINKIINKLTIEKNILMSLLLFIIAIILFINEGFELSYLTIIILSLSIQTFFAGFMINILGIQYK